MRNGIDAHLSVLMRSFGLHRLESLRFWGLVARAHLIVLVHNLVRRRVLLKIAGVEL